MRKDVKVGMAIGGGLIAVLVGYLLFAPPAGNKKGANLITDQRNIIEPGGVGDVAVDNSKPGEVTGTPLGQVPDVSGNPKPAATVGATPTTKPSDSAPAKPGDKPKTGTSTADAGKPADSNGVKPNTTEAVTGGTATHGGAVATGIKLANPNDAWGGGVSTDGVFSNASRSTKGVLMANPADSGNVLAGPNAPVAPPTAGGTHVVRSGETLSSIALLAYGSSAYYPHIQRANPTLNPNNLKLGTVINLPKLEDVKAAAGAGEQSGAKSVTQNGPIDAATQYRVEQGDSLYKIAMKVYGKASFVDKIYEANKSAIGPNPTRLKLGMVLNLPEKSGTVNATPAAKPATVEEISGTTADTQPK